MKSNRLRNNVWRALGSAACLGLLFLGPVHALAQDSSSSTKPTASQSPQEMDQAWQKASAKYDAVRKALLTDVDRTANAGPYRPDWESLRATKLRTGTRTPSLASSFIGRLFGPGFWQRMVSAQYVSGSSDEYKHHVATYGPPRRLVTKISFRVSRRAFRSRTVASSLRPQAPGTSFLSLNTTMASPCTTAASPIGPP